MFNEASSRNPHPWTFSACLLTKTGEQSSVGAVVGALTFHQCGPVSIPGFDAICGLSLLVLYSALKGYSGLMTL